MRIGLIAMSGVRAYDKELMEIGLNLPGFVERSEVVASLPSLSLLTLAAVTPKSVEVLYHEVADLTAQHDLPDDYDLVAISSLSAQVFDAYAIADRYRAKGVPVVMGGLHVSVAPGEAQAHCDSVVVGEGEPLWPELLADFSRGALKPRYESAMPGAYDLKDAPVPRYDLLDPAKYNRLTVQTSRGCPHKCSFCASSILLTNRYKVKPVAKVIDEIHAVKRIWDRPFIEFADDNSFVKREHYRALLRALCKEDLRWFTETDIGVAEDDELLALMRDSGCKQVLIGLESPGRPGLDGIELNANWKLKQLDRYKQAIQKIQSYGITVNGCFVLGLDGDTAEVFDQVRDFVTDSGLFEVQITVLTPFPGTPLYRQLMAEGRLLHEGAWDRCTLFDTNFLPKHMSPQDLRAGLVQLGSQLYSTESTAQRRARFWAMVKESPNARKATLTG